LKLVEKCQQEFIIYMEDIAKLSVSLVFEIADNER